MRFNDNTNTGGVKRPLTYRSVCSGIEAATVAWEPLGWKAESFSEIEKFPSALLKHHYPTVPNHGDFTKAPAPTTGVDVLVGGTPCQSFSVAGLRRGLDDPRGNLTLEFLALAGRIKPQWIVWENVPGVLSDDGGRTFGTFLGLLGQLGYGFAYRVLDAQHWGIPQRRRRVFVVGCLGDWRSAAAVLFERESLRGYPPPSRETGKDVAPTISARTKGGGGLGTDFDLDGGLIAAHTTGSGFWQEGIGTLRAREQESHEHLIAHALNAKGGSGRSDFESETLIAHTLKGEGFDASEDGTGRGIPLVPIGFYGNDSGNDAAANLSPTLRSMSGGGGNHPSVSCGSGVRRLTPGECESLQGFPRNYTAIPFRRKPAKDGPRYKALGNSMAVPVMRWIGEGIAAVDAVTAGRLERAA